MDENRPNPKLSRWRRLFRRDRDSVHSAIETGASVTEPVPRRYAEDTQQAWGQPIEEPEDSPSLEQESESPTQLKAKGAARRLESERSESDMVTPVDPTPPMPPNARTMSSHGRSARARKNRAPLRPGGHKKQRSRARRAKK